MSVRVYVFSRIITDFVVKKNEKMECDGFIFVIVLVFLHSRSALFCAVLDTLVLPN